MKKSLIALLFGCLLCSVSGFAAGPEEGADGGAKAAAPSRPPLKAYAGSRKLAKLAQEFQDERGLDNAWAYSVHADFGAVKEFYKKQIGEPTAESESDDLYFASKDTLEVRITRKAKGWATVELGTRPAASASSGDSSNSGEGSHSGEGSQPKEKGPSENVRSNRPAGPQQAPPGAPQPAPSENPSDYSR